MQYFKSIHICLLDRFTSCALVVFQTFVVTQFYQFN